MASAHRELDRPVGPDIHGQLSQPAAHPTGEPDRNLPQRPAEVFLVEPAMNRLQPVQQKHVAGAGALTAAGARRRWSVLLHWELEKLALGHSPQRTRNPGVQEANDCLEHPVGREGIASVDPQDPPVEAEHHRTVSVGDNSINVSQPELLKPDGKTILQ